MEGKIVSALSLADTELSKFVEQQSILSVKVEEEVRIIYFYLKIDFMQQYTLLLIFV